MNCDQTRELIADWLAGSADAERRLKPHLAACPACRDEAEHMQLLWLNLSTLSESDDSEPGPGLRQRFHEFLDSERARDTRRASSGFFAWLRKPQYAAAGALAAGLLLGFLIFRPAKSDPLQAEVAQLRQLVTLSLLQTQSASDRIRGVDYSNRIQRPDSEVIGALIETVNFDENVNVRLAAVDALERFARQANLRPQLRDSLARQQSPLVQVALINLLVSQRDRQAAPAIRNLIDAPGADPIVVQRAQRGLAQLSQ